MVQEYSPVISHSPEVLLSNQMYLDSLGEARTARHASEEYHASPDPHEVSAAIRDIRKDIANVFKEVSDGTEDDQGTLDDLKATYWRQASRVGTESGAISGYELEDYMRVGEGRSYEEIKQTIEREYPDSSTPLHVLAGIDVYHKRLEINPAHATTIIMEMIGRNLKAIETRAEELGGRLNPEAVSAAFAEFITKEVPPHVNFIAEEYGTGDEAIHSNMYRKSFYPSAEPEAEPVTLRLADHDAAGLVEVYDIQSRPYNQATLRMGNEIAQLPRMQAAMLRVQNELVGTSKRYLEAHPERAAGNLENFSEIFVPTRNEDGSIDELLPNPKLVRAMVNNVMPAVALALNRRGGDIMSMTEDDINEGVRIATDEYRLFQTRIGQFDDYDEDSRTVEMHSTFRVVCPANSIFPKYLKAKLAKYYEDKTEVSP